MDSKPFDPLDGIRRRASMYFGVDISDPGFCDAVLRFVVADALRERAVQDVLRVDVEIIADRVFSVTDDGPGLPIEPAQNSAVPTAMDMLTRPVTGNDLPRGWNLAVVTSVCDNVTVYTVDTNGNGLAFRCSGHEAPEPVEPLSLPSTSGTRLLFSIAADQTGAESKFSNEVGATLEALTDTSRVVVRLNDRRES